MKNIPLFFVHTGNQDYLKYTILQAEKTNDDVYLIGDETNRKVAKKWNDIDKYLDYRYEQFKKLYVNMSTNSAEFELNCFKRYFVCYTFAEQHNINRFIMMDSDCLAFSDFSKLPLDRYDVGASIPENQSNMSWTASPHASLWTVKALDDFIDYLIYEYTYNLSELEQKWNYHKKNKIMGGICDMTLLYLWINKKTNLCVLNTAKGVAGGTFDHFLSVSQGYKDGEFEVVKFCNMKRIKFIGEQPYFKNKHGEWIKAFTIHAQGKSKIYINSLVQYKSGIYPYFKIQLKNFIIKVIRRLKYIKKL